MCFASNNLWRQLLVLGFQKGAAQPVAEDSDDDDEEMSDEEDDLESEEGWIIYFEHVLYF